MRVLTDFRDRVAELLIHKHHYQPQYVREVFFVQYSELFFELGEYTAPSEVVDRILELENHHCNQFCIDFPRKTMINTITGEKW